MRAIKKQGSGGYHLNTAHADSPQSKDDARSRWSSYGHKEALRDRLLDEQFFLCCYSEIQLGFWMQLEALGWVTTLNIFNQKVFIRSVRLTIKTLPSVRWIAKMI